MAERPPRYRRRSTVRRFTPTSGAHLARPCVVRGVFAPGRQSVDSAMFPQAVDAYVNTTPTRPRQRLSLHAVCQLALGAMKVAAQNGECSVENITKIKKKSFKRNTSNRGLKPAHCDALYVQCLRPLGHNRRSAGTGNMKYVSYRLFTFSSRIPNCFDEYFLKNACVVSVPQIRISYG